MAVSIPNNRTHLPTPVTIALDTVYNPVLRGFRTGAAGDVAIVDAAGTTRTIMAMPAGETFKCDGIQQILTVGTTVTSPTTSIIGLQ